MKKLVLLFALIIATTTWAQSAPVISTVTPNQITAGSTGFTLVVSGQNFTSRSKIYWNGVKKRTTFVSRTAIKCHVSAADVAAPGTVSIYVITRTGTATYVAQVRPNLVRAAT